MFNAKKTQLIVHNQTKYALECDEDLIKKENQVQMGPANPKNTRQLWLLQQKKEDAYELVNAITDNILTEDNSQLSLCRGQGNKYQLFQLEFVTDHTFKLRLAKHTQQYVCLKNGQAQTMKVSHNDACLWYLQEVTNNQTLNRSCFIVSEDNKKLIDIPQASRERGERIGIWQGNYRYNQRWNIYKAGAIYVIKSLFTKLNLDIEKQEYQDGTSIIQWPSHGGVNQFWFFERLDPNKQIFRICTIYDRNLELGYHHNKLELFRGKKYKWIIEGYFPE